MWELEAARSRACSERPRARVLPRVRPSGSPWAASARLVARYVDRRRAKARSSAVARAPLIDDTIRALARSIDRLGILGAGFDAGAYLLDGLSEVAVFEVNHPDTLARKRTALRQVSFNLPSRLRLVGFNFKSELIAAIDAL